MNAPRTAINWEAVRERLANSQSHLGVASVNRQRVGEVFRERAAQLARRGRSASAEGQRTPALAFRVGGERMAVELRHVAQVYPRPAITAVPGAADHLLGVAHLQGKVQSVVHLGRLMGVTAEDAADGFVMLIRAGAATIGLWVDAVDEVCHFDRAALVPLDDASRGVANGLILGVMSDRRSVLNPASLVTQLRQGRADSPSAGETE